VTTDTTTTETTTRDNLKRLLPGSVLLPARSLDDQVFSMDDADSGLTYHWNASEGRRMAERRGDILDFCPSDFGIDLAHIRERYQKLDEAYAMFTDLTVPLLFVPFAGSGSSGSDHPTAQLIDGWHRLFKAVVTGAEVLPAYLLTQEEADRILIGKTPLGAFPLAEG
jgi:hypothetical protein